ncbi:MAG TPA: FMN-binding protein [Acidimicrobiales bacterium]|nr:FMN-binding protein [Acidimicrobiales bacterium]
MIGATGVGLGLLLSFHTKPVHVNIAATGTSPDTGSGPSPGSDAGTTPTAPTTTAGPGAPTPTSAPTTAPTSSKTATSQLIQYQYGDIQLRVTEKGTRLTNIQVVSEGATDPRSAEINSQAVPMLQQQAMSAQSANIDGVSGATFTSIAYDQALQSALDQLHQ